jgi:hypothetical protein
MGPTAAFHSQEDPDEKAKKDAAKLREKIYKEGGKKGVEIEGASEMGGLDFFCTTLELPDGNIEYLELSMTAMNAEPDPSAEERKGCSGLVGKMIFSAGVQQLAMVGYVPDLEFNKSSDKVDVTAWMEDVCKAVSGEIVKPVAAVTSVMPDGSSGKITGKVVSAIVKSDPEKGKFALKDKDSAMAAAFANECASCCQERVGRASRRTLVVNQRAPKRGQTHVHIYLCFSMAVHALHVLPLRTVPA